MQAKIEVFTMKRRTYGISRDSRTRGWLEHVDEHHEQAELGGVNDGIDANQETALGNYVTQRSNGSYKDNPTYPFPVDGKWSWVKSDKEPGHYHLRYDEGSGDKVWMQSRDDNYLKRLNLERKQIKGFVRNIKQAEARERELSEKNSELVLELSRQVQEIKARKNELHERNSELVLELVQERQQRAERERELEIENSTLLQEQQRNSERRLEAIRLELEQERQQKEAKEKELEAIKLKLKTARSALLPTIPSDTVSKKKPPLAQGGYGFVYRGEWLGETIALKELMNPYLTDDAIAEFKEEALKMACLRSPYVVTVYGITLNAQGRLKGIVMEYMPQGSLYTILSNSEIALSWSLRHKMALAVARGLSILHQQNIIYNDLKSLNVLVRHQGDKWELKLTDFGLSRIKQETAKFTNNKPQGTAAWMAPELFKEKVYSKASDVYAYGIVLWEIVSRETPFDGLEAFEISPKVVNDKERPPIPTAAPSSLVALMGLCWKQNREERLPTEEVITKLEALPLKQELREFDDRDDAGEKSQNQGAKENTLRQWSMG